MNSTNILSCALDSALAWEVSDEALGDVITDFYRLTVGISNDALLFGCGE